MSEALLSVRQLSRRFGALDALQAVDLDIAEGEVHALIGPNGAGKTTFIHHLSGALFPDSGQIRFAGHEVTALPMHRRVAAGMARSWQITNIFPRLSVEENVVLAVMGRPAAGSGFRFWRPAAAERQLVDSAHEVIERVGLQAHLARPAGQLAHGEQRALELAMALATSPRLLLLDEPMAGTGPEESARMVALIESLARHVTLLLVEHDMDAVFRLADRISVLVNGRLIATGTPQEIRAHPEVRRAYLGEDA